METVSEHEKMFCKRDTLTIGQIQGLALRYASLISGLFFAAALSVPHLLMRIFTQDESLISLGSAYLRWVSVSYLMMGVSQVVLAVMKSIGQTKLSASISLSPQRHWPDRLPSPPGWIRSAPTSPATCSSSGRIR